MPNLNKFTDALRRRFAPGGSLSTPKKRKKVPARNFLMPGERKFPVKVNGKVNQRLVRAAIRRAAQTGRPNIEAKARKLLKGQKP